MSELDHGLLLQDQGKLEEAESCFLGVLAREPENDFVYSRLALCRMSQSGRKRDALQSIDEAIRLRADESYYHSIRSLILGDLHRGKEALEAADRALALSPHDAIAYVAKASAYCDLQRWADAENWALQALAIDSDNVMAANILTHALRLQGKADQNAIAVDQLLANDPESSLSHVNAGWAALQRHDNSKAEEHFLEALRLDPDCEVAREGLLEAFKARSWFYRVYLSYCFAMQRFTGGKQWAIIIGLYLAYRFLAASLKNVSPILWGAVVFLWLGFVMWVWLAPGIGNFLVLLDSSARHALKKGEKLLGIAVGGGLLLGIIFLVFGFWKSSDPLLAAGFGAIVSTVPASLTFANDSRSGSWVFGAITASAYLATIAIVLVELFLHPESGPAPISYRIGLPVFLASLLCTWLGNIPALRRDRSGA